MGSMHNYLSTYDFIVHVSLTLNIVKALLEANGCLINISFLTGHWSHSGHFFYPFHIQKQIQDIFSRAC